MLSLYQLLPEFYRFRDAELGEPLREFLEPLQAVLEACERDEETLRVLQDPHQTPAPWLHYIARSLDWVFLSEEEEARRNEATEIVNIYDLKGTPYAMRLIMRLIFGKLFQRLIEFFPGGTGSISRLRQPWASANATLKSLLVGEGDFPVPQWKEEQESRRGRPYDFDPTAPYWHYVAHLRVPPELYMPGKLRAGIERLIQVYDRFHPAGRFLYLWVEAPSDREGRHGTAVIQELIGAVRLDMAWEWDEEGRTFDAAADPVHPSISWLFPLDLYRLDEERVLDNAWHWDEGELAAHAVIELG